MIEYNVYWKSNSVITGEDITWIQGIFLNEDNAKLFLKALQKAHPESSKSHSPGASPGVFS